MGSEPSLEYCELSDIGRRRASNQDASAVVPAETPGEFRRRGWLFLVADGMGAHAAGETASRLAKEQVPLAYEKLASRSPPLALQSSIEHANRVIHERGETSPDLKGMGTTCSVLAIVPRGALVGHVGDSRIYRVREATIEQLSWDHSLAWEVEAARKAAGGAQLQHPALQDPPKNIITRSLGPHGRVEVDVEGPFPVAAGDVFVLCSDGLSGQVADEEIGCLAAALPPSEAAAALVGLALVRGAPDNVTLIVARAGPKERSERSAEAARWPLTPADAARRRSAPGPIPSRWFILAAAGLLGALIFNPWAELMARGGFLDGLLGGLAPAIGTALTGLMALLALAGVLAALLEMSSSDEDEVRTLRTAVQRGQSPYRSYACPLTAELVDGIASSVESAADGLADEERSRALGSVAAARRRAKEGNLPAALAEAVDGLAVYRRAVEAARGDDPTRIENR